MEYIIKIIVVVEDESYDHARDVLDAGFKTMPNTVRAEKFDLIGQTSMSSFFSGEP